MDLYNSFRGRAKDLSLRKKVLLIIFVSLTVHTTLAAYSTTIDYSAHKVDDYRLYMARTSTILHGGILYRDVYTEPPPGIVYILLIPAIFGNTPVSYMTFFTFLNTLTALILFYITKRGGEEDALLLSLLFLTNPVVFLTATTAHQDEAVVGFIFIVGLYLILRGRYRLASLETSFGFWTKMWTAFLIPYIILRKESLLRERLVYVAVMAAVTAAMTLPYLYFCPKEFTFFLRYYFLTVHGRESGGITLWHFLDFMNLKPPSLFFYGTLATGEIYFLYQYWRDKMVMWRSLAAAVLWFFIFYPKIHYGYYIILLLALLPYAPKIKGSVISFYLIGVLGILQTGFWLKNIPRGPYMIYPLLVGVFIMLMLFYLLLRLLKLEEDPRGVQFWEDEDNGE